MTMRRRKATPRNTAGGAGRMTHVTSEGQARMVDVTSKTPGPRSAKASAFVSMSAETVGAVRTGISKGDPLGTARVAGIMAAKRTHELIPLCHPLAITDVKVDLELTGTGVEITAAVKTADRTGVEMEALTAAAVAALTVYDMCKSLDKAMTIEHIELIEKTGGKSGTWRRK